MMVRPYLPKDREAVLALRRRRFTDWYGADVAATDFDPEEMRYLFVCEDKGRVAGVAGGALRVEFGLLMDESVSKTSALRRLIPRLWAKVAGAAYREGVTDGIGVVSVAHKFPKWERVLTKWLGFKRVDYPAYRVDLEKEFEDAKRYASK